MEFAREAALQYEKDPGYRGGGSSTLMRVVRDGVEYSLFQSYLDHYPFSMEEWAGFLHISDRTMLRYKKEGKSFESLQSEKILQITLFYEKGVEVFGSKENFDTWLYTKNLALGGVLPKELLDNAFGIEILNEELIRIEHGVLA